MADPRREEQARRPLTEHLEDYRRHLESKGDERGHIAETIARVKKILDGCRFTLPGDLAAEPVLELLAGMLKETLRLPALDPAKELHTKKELAALLRVTLSAIPPLVRRHRLPVEGQGKKRRFPRTTVGTLLARAAEPVGPRTVNAYLTAARAFTR